MVVKYTDKSRELRAKLLSEKVDPPKPVVINGDTYYVRKPLISDRDGILELALGRRMTAKDKHTIPSTDRMVAAAIIKLACDEVGCPLFELADFDALRGATSGSAIEKLGVECMGVLNPGKTSMGKAHGARPETDSSSASPSASVEPSPNSEA